MPLDQVTVSVTDGVKTGDYAPPRSYTFTAVLSQPEEAALEKTVIWLKSAGEAFLGRKTVHVTQSTNEAPKDPTPGQAETPAKPARRKASSAPPAADPASISDETGSGAASETGDVKSPDVGSEAHTGNAPASDPAAMSEPEDWEQGAAEITDKELTDATTRKNAELGEPVKVRELIQTFKPKDAPADRVMRLTEIAQADRARYLAELKALAK